MKQTPHNATQHQLHQHKPSKPILLLSLFVAALLALSACSGSGASEVAAGAGGEDGAGDQSQDRPVPGDATNNSPNDGTDPLDPEGGQTQPEITDGAWKIVEPNKDLQGRTVTFPEAWIVSDDGTSIEVRFVNGVEPCSGADVTVVETGDVVTVTLETGFLPGAEAATCILLAEQKAIVVDLAEPLADRKLEISEPVAQKPLEVEMPAELAQFVGLSLDDAGVLAAELGYITRIARIDDEWFGLTEDYDEQRLNFEVENDTVVNLSNW